MNVTSGANGTAGDDASSVVPVLLFSRETAGAPVERGDGVDAAENAPTVDGEVSAAVERLNKILDVDDGNTMRFQVQSDTGRAYIEIVNQKTGETIRTIPGEAMLEFHARFEAMMGLLYDETA